MRASERPAPRGKPHALAWEKDYRVRGALWRPSHSAPALQKSDARVLDVGCGDGKTLVPLVRDGFRVTGVDVSPTALRHCGDKLRAEGLAATLVEADATALPLPDNFFNAVLSIHVLDHLLEGERVDAAREMARVLRPGGRLLFKGFARGDFREGKGRVVEPGTYRRGNNVYYHYFTEEEVQKLFSEGAGLTPVFVGTEQRTAPYEGRELPRRKVAAAFVKNPASERTWRG